MINLLTKLKVDKKKIFVLLAACLLIVYIDITFLIKLQLKNMKTLQPKLTKLKSDIDNLTKELTIMQELKNKQGQIPQNVASKVKKLIFEGQLPELLEDIYNMANRNRVKVMQINPSKGSKENEKRLVLDLSGDYHRLGQFLNAIENMEKFIDVESIEIKTEPNNYFQQKVNLVLKIYVKK